MPAQYPSAIKTFTQLVDGVDDVLAAHPNERGDEITAIETELGTNPRGSFSDVKTRLDQATFKPGDIIETARSEASRTGWLACDGAAVSRTTFADLFAAIGTSYGSGDGSTTFNLPNMNGKVPRGNANGAGGGVDAHAHDMDTGSATAEIQVNPAGMGDAVYVHANGFLGATTSGAGGGTVNNVVKKTTQAVSHVPAHTQFKYWIKT